MPRRPCGASLPSTDDRAVPHYLPPMTVRCLITFHRRPCGASLPSTDDRAVPHYFPCSASRRLSRHRAGGGGHLLSAMARVRQTTRLVASSSGAQPPRPAPRQALRALAQSKFALAATRPETAPVSTSSSSEVLVAPPLSGAPARGPEAEKKKRKLVKAFPAHAATAATAAATTAAAATATTTASTEEESSDVPLLRRKRTR
ncbi:hypothetical protein VNO80_06826 [Phaseolus coccineus]|uniref:Uncharacterized protein n=1 Tax=Phaseolus coccineus TaxID=3886 RepID=A0AAN9NMY4_PHACN